jgi:hypothetical protein
MTGALSSGVENGSWTVEEGLINGLRFMAGEIFPDGFRRRGTDQYRRAGLIEESQHYLAEGTDEQTKSDVQHYLEMLMPSPEVLISIPPGAAIKCGCAFGK